MNKNRQQQFWQKHRIRKLASVICKKNRKTKQNTGKQKRRKGEQKEAQGSKGSKEERAADRKQTESKAEGGNARKHGTGEESEEEGRRQEA